MCAEVVCVDIRDIRYFIAIAEEHSMSKAAQSLFVSQPTLSQTIKKLEEEFGTSLSSARATA